MPKSSKRIFLLCVRIATFSLCGIVSAYILASGYESIYNKPLPFVSTIAAVNLDAFKGVYRFTSNGTVKNSYYGNFGKPVTLKIPASSLRLNIVSAIKDGSSWLGRPSTLQLLIPSPPRSGNIGVAFLYCRSGFRTIDATTLPAPGQNIFMDTDQNWRYVYKVTASHDYSGTAGYVPSDDGSTGKLLIDCYDAGSHDTLIIEANLLSVQGVEQ
jgi:hypothetical protein